METQVNGNERVFEAKIPEGTMGYNLADFLQKMYKEEYQWYCGFLDYSGNHYMLGIDVSGLVKKIENSTYNGEWISWEDLQIAIRSIFQVMAIYIETRVEKDGSLQKIFGIDLIDGYIVSFEYNDEADLQRFKEAGRGWIDVDNPLVS